MALLLKRRNMIRYTWKCPDRWQIIHIEACHTCICVVSNGVETEDDAETADRIDKNWPPSEGWAIHDDCREDCETYFSWGRCDGCDAIAGDRHRAVAMRRIRR